MDTNDPVNVLYNDDWGDDPSLSSSTSSIRP
jgi:hypothetical protein